LTLQLEYSCTEKDQKEAKALRERENFGGGPKWRSNLIMFLVLGLASVGVVIRFTTEIAPKDRWWFIMLVALVFAIWKYFQRKTTAKTGDTVRVEVSERAIVIGGENSRTELLWSGFSKCLETPNLFVLLNRSKSVLYIIPKRAFSDEKSQEWFRSQANQPGRAAAESAAHGMTAPERFVASRGIALVAEYKFRDHLNRHLTSWRVKGMLLVVAAILIGVSIVSFINPPPDAVDPPWKVVLLLVGTFVPMVIVVFSVVLVFWWFTQKRQSPTHYVVVTKEGVEFTERDSNGRLPWNTYKYYRETRSTFFIWNPKGSIWFMFSKRAFNSPSDLDQFRALLQSNLKPSRWFYM
jgi:hypothetical protein